VMALGRGPQTVATNLIGNIKPQPSRRLVRRNRARLGAGVFRTG
jgi:hypothetical protein